MEIAFWAIGIIGALIALASFAGADFLDLEVDVSTTSIAATMAGFGFGGVIAIGLGVESDAAILGIAAACAAVGWVFSLILYLFMKRQETPDDQSDMGRLVGTDARVVYVPTKKGGWGELTTTFRGQVTNMNFRCDESVSVGDLVTITAVISAQQAVVKPAAESNGQ